MRMLIGLMIATTFWAGPVFADTVRTALLQVNFRFEICEPDDGGCRYSVDYHIQTFEIPLTVGDSDIAYGKFEQPTKLPDGSEGSYYFFIKQIENNFYVYIYYSLNEETSASYQFKPLLGGSENTVQLPTVLGQDNNRYRQFLDFSLVLKEK